ncbi:MAG: HEAT repeat domain-containing protein [Polyangiaceae bacterium]
MSTTAGATVTHSEQQRIDRVRGALDGDERSLLLGMRSDPSWVVRREVIAALAALGDSVVPALLESLVNERKDETRIAATVDTLAASTGNVEALLRPLLKNSSSQVLADLANILGRRRNTASVSVLAELSKHSDDNVAVAAIEGLGRVGGRAVVDVLVEAVQSGNFSRTFAAIDVLGRSGDPRAIAPLAHLLDSVYFSIEAARALGRTRDRAAVAPLAQRLSSSAEANVRIAALALADLHAQQRERFGTSEPIDEALRKAVPAVALRRLDQTFGGADVAEKVAICVVLGALRDERARSTLLRALNEPPPVATAAADALKALGSDSTQEVLAALRESGVARRLALLPILTQIAATADVAQCLLDEEPAVRAAACDALARIGNPAAASALMPLLDDANPGVVRATVAALQSLGSSETYTLTLQAARSERVGVRRAALRVLAYFGHEPALPLFIDATRDSDARVREVAIGGLAFLGQGPALDTLLQLARAPEPKTRANALRALGDTTSDERVIAQLTGALSDADAWARYYACQALGKLAVESATAAIVQRLDDDAGQVRVAAIEALSHLRGDLAFSALKHASQQPDPDARRAALIGLGLSRRIEALPLLCQVARAPEAATRLVALSALAELDDPRALDELARAVDDDDENVSSAAIGFLGERAGSDATQILCALLARPALRHRVQGTLATPREGRVAGLLAALRSADDELAARLTSILARLNQPEATAALFEGMTLPNAAARKAAATTLVATGKPHAHALLHRLSAEDPDAEVRRVCSLLLAQ